MLLISTAAAGAEDLQTPADIEGVYQIGTAEDLLWFSSLVNGTLEGTAQNTDVSAALTCDIDMSGTDWTPVGSSYNAPYTGDFDGQGHQITGIEIESADSYAGVFGWVKNAAISNVTVRGQITGDNSAIGGLVAKSVGGCAISGCGNEIDVTNVNARGSAAGILGNSMNGGDTISGCFNRGEISANSEGGRASGIVAEMGSGRVENCYNTGNISADKANGIGSASGLQYQNCYNAGKVTGTTSAFGIGASNYADYANCYYASGLSDSDEALAEADRHGQPKAADEMSTGAFVKALGDGFQIDRGAMVNGGYPLLSWESPGTDEAVVLQTPQNLQWLPQQGELPEDADLLYEDMKAGWDAVPGAERYEVKLYQGEGTEPVFTASDIKQTEYSFYEAFAAMDETGVSTYHFTVTALGDGEAYEDSAESAKDRQGLEFDAGAFIGVVSDEDMKWNEASKIAVWKEVPNADFYITALYSGNKKIVEYELTEEMINTESGKISMYFINSMTREGDYSFTVQAGRIVDDQDSPNFGKRCVGRIARSKTTHFEGVSGEAVEIDSVEDWISIVNIDNEGTDYASAADAQNAAWSKRYELKADLDFSKLSAEQQIDMQSWGNIDAPFSGILEGGGHKIKGLTLSSGNCGLFAYIGTTGIVRDLTIEGANAQFSDNAGVLCQFNYGKIQNCAVIRSNITADTGSIIGGFASRNFNLIENCYVEGGELKAGSTTATGHAGFVGNNFGQIRSCWTSMDISTSSYCAGGFSGWADESGDRTGSFEDCFALGDVDAARGWSGGFVGRVNSKHVTFSRCYAAGKVTSEQKPERAYGFIGAISGEAARDIIGSSAFNEDIPEENFTDCFYASDQTPQDNPKKNYTTGKSLEEMKTAEFAETLGLAWTRENGKNNGLPYLEGVPCPGRGEARTITVELAIALYDKEKYAFDCDGDVIKVKMTTTGNTRVIDVMNEAKKQGKMDFEYTITPAYGSFIESINGHPLSAPDGWMFTINDRLSSVSANLATIEDGDQILWYQGTTQNLFTAPGWEEITGTPVQNPVISIRTKDDLMSLCGTDANMTASYRLEADIDLQGAEFDGIGRRDKPFAGTFDGNGHTISNVKIDQPEEHNVGFFSFIKGAKIRDLNIEGAQVTGKYSVGVLVGVAAVELDTAGQESKGNSIGGCHVSGTVTSENKDQSGTTDGSYAGGLIGFNDGATDDKTKISVMSSVDRCSADVTVKAGSIYSGGLAGGNFGYITDSSASGSVNGARCSGGFVGGNNGGIYDSWASGDVSGTDHTGGFAGTTYTAIHRCYSTGSVMGRGEQIGGFTGSGSGEIKNCISTGSVTATSYDQYIGSFAGHYTGALSGLAKDITFADNYGWADGQITKAIGNKASSTVEAEQKVLDASKVTELEHLKDVFRNQFGKELNDDRKVAAQEDSAADPEKLMESIAISMQQDLAMDDLTCWIISDLAAYEKHGGRISLTKEQKQQFVDLVAAEVTSSRVQAGELARDIIAFRALGYDARALKLEDGATIDMVDLLKQKDYRSETIFTQPYILMALSMGEGYSTEAEQTEMIGIILSQQKADGSWGGADATGPVLQALAPHLGDRDVQAAVDKAADPALITGWMNSKGAAAYDGAATVESTAQAILGLTGAGKAISDYTKNDKTLAEGLLSFADGDDGFKHDDQGSGSRAIATEQGFRGLIAALHADAGNPFLLYDFAGNAAETAVSQVKAPKPGGPEETEVGTVVLKSVKKKTKKSLMVKWEALDDVSGYQIRYSRNKGFKEGTVKTITVTDKTRTQYQIKKLKRKKTWYVQVRAYKTQGSDTIYGQWSKTKSRKLK